MTQIIAGRNISKTFWPFLFLRFLTKCISITSSGLIIAESFEDMNTSLQAGVKSGPLNIRSEKYISKYATNTQF